MKRTIRNLIMAGAAVTLLFSGHASASARTGFEVTLLVDGAPRREYHHQGTTYVEALRGKEYVLRLTNPTPRRVAVALSVDGLNTIDAKHTSAKSASKWVIGPYDTIDISGWQVNDRAARAFFFTGERDSYGAVLGEVENLGVIEAVFFLEKEPDVSWWSPKKQEEAERRGGVMDAPSAEGMGRDAAGSKAQAAPRPDDDYAATGMGDRHRHDVRAVEMRLEDRPAASVRIRYEFRRQLVDLGVVPEREFPLDRRERASGFDGFCPEPGSRR